MICFFLQYIGGVALTLILLWLVWWSVEVKDLVPPFLQFKPYNCRTCLTFWLTVGVAVGVWMVGWWVTATTMAVMALLDAIAMHLDDKERFSYD